MLKVYSFQNLKKMNKAAFILPVVSVVCLWGCHDRFDETGLDNEIVLKSYIPSSVASKAAELGYDYDYNFDEELPLSVLRWDEGGSTDPADYPQPLSATLGNPDPSDGWRRNITFDPPQYFLDGGKAVGFAACYPPITEDYRTNKGEKGKWASVNDGILTFNIDGQTDVMISDFKSGNISSGIESLTFEHALCMYKVFVYAVDEDTKKQWGELNKVTFLNLPEQLFVSLPDDMTSGNVNFTYTGVPSDSEYTSVDINLSGEDRVLGVGVENRKYVGSYLGGSPSLGLLGINVNASNQTSSSPISIARNFQPGKTYNLILRLSSHGVINADLVVEDWTPQGVELPSPEISTKFFTDLTRYGTANSYIVTSANMGYSFDVTVKGNGVNRLKGFKKEVVLPDTDPSLNTAKVRLIEKDASFRWDAGQGKYVPLTDPEERKNAPLITVQEQLSDNKALFEIPGSDVKDDYRLQYKGNAIIGGYNSMDELIWSWHIWITDKPLNINYGNGYIVMDRNLGAVSSDPNDYIDATYSLSAMCYQWGRKDPIDILDIKQYPEDHLIKAPVSIEDAHKNPGKFFYLTKQEYESGMHDWTTQSSPHLWGYVSDRDDIQKTLYDPCPPGYRVNGNMIWEYPGGDMKAPEYAYKGGKKIGYLFGIENYTEIFYPSNTFVEYDGSLVVNSGHGGVDNGDPYIYQYSATPYVPAVNDSGMDALSYHFRYNKTSASGENTGYSTLAYQPELCGGRVHAYPVRCVYENSKKSITDLSSEQTANSYIIEESGYYKFDVDTPGNGVGSLAVQFTDGSIKQIVYDGGVGFSLHDMVNRVDVLWWQGDLTSGSSYQTFASQNRSAAEIEAECPVVLLDNGKPDGKDVVFYVPKDRFQNSNVILAGYDSNDNIVWSWHLWLVKGGVDVTDIGSFSVMDRNLGATFAPSMASDINENNALATFGFHYQWGRKDPFVPMAKPVPDDVSVSSPWFYKDNDGNWTRKTQIDTYAGYFADIKTSIANPTSFAVPGTASNAWQDEYPNSSGDTGNSPANQFWGYTGVPGAWGDTFAKTIWDPCPPGYKVSTQATFDSGGLWYGDTTHGSVGNESYWGTISGDDWSSSYGVFLDTGDKITNASNTVSPQINSDRGIWFPYNRMIHHVDGKYQSLRSSSEMHLHTACPTGGFGSREMVIYNNYGMIVSQYTAPTARGSAVRCLKE